MIVMDEKIAGIWFMPTTPTQDWMLAIRELVPEEQYELVYRFRYYTDKPTGDPFADDDRKSWYKGEVTGTRAYVIASIRSLADKMYQASGMEKPYELLNDGDLKKFMRTFAEAPFAFMRQKPATPENLEE